MKYKIKATDKYVKENVKDKELERIPNENEEWEVEEERKDLLIEKGFAILVEEVEEIEENSVATTEEVEENVEEERKESSTETVENTAEEKPKRNKKKKDE